MDSFSDLSLFSFNIDTDGGLENILAILSSYSLQVVCNTFTVNENPLSVIVYFEEDGGFIIEARPPRAAAMMVESGDGPLGTPGGPAGPIGPGTPVVLVIPANSTRIIPLTSSAVKEETDATISVLGTGEIPTEATPELCF